MKTLARILGILVLLVALLTCSMSIYRAGLDKEKAETEIAEANKQLDEFRQQANSVSGEAKTYLDSQVKEAEKIIADAPSGSTYTIVQVFLGVLLVLTLVFAVLLFKANKKLAMQLLAAAVIVTLIVYFASPDIERGKYSGLNSRALALLSGIPVIIVGLCAFLVGKKSEPKS